MEMIILSFRNVQENIIDSMVTTDLELLKPRLIKWMVQMIEESFDTEYSDSFHKPLSEYTYDELEDFGDLYELFEITIQPTTLVTLETL